MLAFDIETTGLDKSTHAVTVVSLYGSIGQIPVDTVLNFARDGVEPNRTVLMDHMARAHCLCAFNGARFDIPFLMAALSIPSEVGSSWVLKLCDPFEVTPCSVAQGTPLIILLTLSPLLLLLFHRR